MPGRGRLRRSFPASKEQAPISPPAPQPPGGRGHLLVLDDGNPVGQEFPHKLLFTETPGPTGDKARKKPVWRFSTVQMLSAKLSPALRLNNAVIESLIPNVRLGIIELFIGEV
jgi:hypothetical protein